MEKPTNTEETQSTASEELLRADAVQLLEHISALEKRLAEMEGGIFKYCLDITEVIPKILPAKGYNYDVCNLCDSHYVIFGTSSSYGGDVCADGCKFFVCKICMAGETATPHKCSTCGKHRCETHIRKIIDKMVCYDCDWMKV